MPNNKLPLDRIFWALGDPTRFAIIEHLAGQSASVTELAKPFSMALPSFLQHLGILEECGLVSTKKQGRVRFCKLNKKKFDEVNSWLNYQRRLWDTRLDALDRLLEKKS